MDTNATTAVEGTTPESSDGMTKIISTVVTITFVIIFVAVLCALYRLVCRPRGKDNGIVGKSTGKRKEFVDQFDVNCSQLDLEADEKKFINPAAKITSESESTSSNLSSLTSPESSSALGMLVKSIHGDTTKFTVSKVRDRSSRPSSLKIKVPKQFAADDEQFTLALIDKRSQTIHSLGMNDCLVVDQDECSAALTPTSALFAQRWKEKSRIRRSRGGSIEGRRSSSHTRVRILPRQASCPTGMVAKGFQSESLSSHSEDSSSQNDTVKHAASLSSIDEAAHNPYTEAIFIQ